MSEGSGAALDIEACKTRNRSPFHIGATSRRVVRDYIVVSQAEERGLLICGYQSQLSIRGDAATSAGTRAEHAQTQRDAVPILCGCVWLRVDRNWHLYGIQRDAVDVGPDGHLDLAGRRSRSANGCLDLRVSCRAH